MGVDRRRRGTRRLVAGVGGGIADTYPDDGDGAGALEIAQVALTLSAAFDAVANQDGRWRIGPLGRWVRAVRHDPPGCCGRSFY
jgi:hypothetical protein